MVFSIRFWRFIAVAIVTATLFSFAVLAHPGDTDNQGGHTDHSTGQYHFHHGYPPHQHTGGVCPYEFDDKTGWSSGSNNGSSETEKENIEDRTEGVEREAKRDTGILEKVFLWICTAIFGLIIVVIPSLSIIAVILTPIVIWVSNWPYFKKKKEQKRIAERQRQIDFFGGKSAREMAGVPNGIVFSDTFWPTKRYEESLVVAYSEGTKYHRPECHYVSSNYKQVSVYQIPKATEPCSRCKPVKVNDVPEWLRKYREYIIIKKNYQIYDPDVDKNILDNRQRKENDQLYKYLVDISVIFEFDSPTKFVECLEKNALCRQGKTEAEAIQIIETAKRTQSDNLVEYILAELQKCSAIFGLTPIEILTEMHANLLVSQGKPREQAKAIASTKKDEYFCSNLDRT